MNIIKNITTKTNIKCPYSMAPTRIVVHNTANDASARSEINYMNSNDNQTSFHYAVDDIDIVQGIEENKNAWHAGDGKNGIGNRQGIAIEICYSKSGGDRFTKAEANAVRLIIDILRRYRWGIDKVTKHQDYSGKYCPHRTLDMGWQRFLNMIQAELNPPIVEQPKPIEKYTLIVEVPVYTNSTNAKNGVGSTTRYYPGEYFIFNKANGMVNITKSQNTPGGWINPSDNIIKQFDPIIDQPVENAPISENKGSNEPVDRPIDDNHEEKENESENTPIETPKVDEPIITPPGDQKSNSEVKEPAVDNNSNITNSQKDAVIKLIFKFVGKYLLKFLSVLAKLLKGGR